MRLALAILLLAAAGCGGGDPEPVQADDPEIAELIEIVETLGAMYAKNTQPQEDEE